MNPRAFCGLFGSRGGCRQPVSHLTRSPTVTGLQTMALNSYSDGVGQYPPGGRTATSVDFNRTSAQVAKPPAQSG